MQSSAVATFGTEKDHDIDSDSDESELNEESIRASYENMYSQWIRVVDQNRSLEGRISALIQYKENSEIKVQKLETLLTEKEAKLKEVSVELERTQKSLKMLNSGTDKLNHILSVGKSSSDHKGLGFEGEHSNSKTVFVKSSVSNSFAGTSADVVTQKPYVTTQNKIASPSQVTGNRADVATYLKSAASGSTGKHGKFIPTCHFCGVKGHIKPRCFTMVNFLKNKYFSHEIPFQRKTPRKKIDLSNKTRKV